jgi:hypothetical protein
MTRAFIVNLDVGSDTDFNSIAEEINDELSNAGFIVTSVAPWQSPTTSPTLGSTSLAPTSPTPPNPAGL